MTGAQDGLCLNRCGAGLDARLERDERFLHDIAVARREIRRGESLPLDEAFDTAEYGGA